MQKQVVEKRLEELPEKIQVKQTEVLELSDDIENLILQKKTIEAGVHRDVEDEMDDLGKKRYSNKEAREIETKSRAERDKAYITIRKTLDENKLKKRTAEVEYDFLRRSFRAAESLTRCL